MVNSRFAPRFRSAGAAPRLIYFIDSVKVRKVDAIRAVMMHLILARSSEWDYATAERELAHSGPRNPVDTGRFQRCRQNIWVEAQMPKIKRERR